MTLGMLQLCVLVLLTLVVERLTFVVVCGTGLEHVLASGLGPAPPPSKSHYGDPYTEVLHLLNCAFSFF